MTADEIKDRFRGPMVSVATPFTKDFKLDAETMKRNIRFMIDHGVKTGQGSLLVAAAGGEFPFLTMEERKTVIRVSVEAARGEVPVAASLQYNRPEESAELAQFAFETGVELGQLSGPFYYSPTHKDIVQHFQIVSDRSKLPLMIYANWWITGDFSMDLVEALYKIPRVVALKWAARTSSIFEEGLLRFADRLAIIDNAGQHILSPLMGGIGYITHISNFWPEYDQSIWTLMQQNKFHELLELLKLFKFPWKKWRGKVMQETEGEGPFIKAAMDVLGIPAGPPRPPAHPVSEKLREELRTLLTTAEVPQAVY